jgi:transcriptional regulator with XRE-family HTH domain
MARKSKQIKHHAIVAKLGARVREEREIRKWSQDDLRKAAGNPCATNHISRIENCKIAAGIDLVAQLAEAFGMSVGVLLGEPPSDGQVATNGDIIRSQVESILEHANAKTIEALRLVLSKFVEKPLHRPRSS